MLGLPKATELIKQLPKNAIYAKFQMNTAERAKIDADISRITIVNEVSPAKINIADGERVKSFFVLLVALKWKRKEDISIELKGLNMDTVWKNIIVQIGGITIEQGNTLDEQIAVDEQRMKIQKEIDRLTKLAKNEKQPKKKFELVQKINGLKKELI